MANELESLLVRLEADTASLRRELKNAESGVDAYEQKTNRSLGRAEKNFQRYSATATKQLQAVAAAASAAFGSQAIGAAVGDTARLTLLAEAAGLTAQKYQELRGAASLAGVQHAEFDNVLSQFAEKAGEARARTGDLYEFLKFALPTVAQQIGATKDTASALALMSDTAQRLTRAEERAIFTKKAFSGASAELTAFLASGSAAMGNAAGKARELGLVLDNDALKAAQRTREEYNKLTTQLDGSFKAALVAVLPAVNAVARDVAAMFDTSKEMNAGRIAGAPDVYSMKQLEAAAASLKKELQGIQDTAAKGTAGNTFAEWKNWIGLTKLEANGLATALAAVNKEMEARAAFADGGSNRLGMFGAGMKPQGAWQTTTTRDDALTLRQKPNYTAVDAMNQLKQSRLTAAGDSAQLIAMEYDTELERFRRMLEDKTISEAQYNNAREQLGNIRMLKIQKEVEVERVALAQKLAPMLGVIEQSLAQPLQDAFNGGMKSMKEYFASFAKSMALAMQQALILKPIMDSITNSVTTGGTGSFMSSLFSTGSAAARATGGPVVPGRPYMVGEQGPELIVPNLGGTVMSNTSLMRSGAGGAAGGSVYNIDARQADVGVVPRIMEALRALEAARPAPATAVAATARRYPTRRG